MEYRSLGTTDLKISRLGFGCWAIGGHGYGDVDDQESINAIRRALDLGVTVFDTADVYGLGHSEEILSTALGPQRENVVIATKGGVRWKEDGKTYKDCSRKSIIAALEGSLRRLKVDSIPLYQIHWHDGITPIEETVEALCECKRQGKIKHIGCSNFSLELIQAALETERIDSLQTLYSATETESGSTIEACSQRLGMGIIAYGVLSRGLLAGNLTPGTSFGLNDTRSTDPKLRDEEYERRCLVADELKKTAERYGKMPAQVALRWVLENPNVSCALVGVKTHRQITENTGAFGWGLSKKDRDSISAAVGNNVANQGE